MSASNGSSATFAMRKTNAAAAPTRVTVKSKKFVAPKAADSAKLPAERAPSYTDSLDSSHSSSSDVDGSSAPVPPPSQPPVDASHSAALRHDAAHDLVNDDPAASTRVGGEAEEPDDYYVLRSRPSLTVAERVERLKAAQAAALQERAVQQLPTQGVARRPATLVRSRHGTVRSLAPPAPPARASQDGPATETILALEDRQTSEPDVVPSARSSSSPDDLAEETGGDRRSSEGDARAAAAEARQDAPVTADPPLALSPLKIDCDDEDEANSDF